MSLSNFSLLFVGLASCFFLTACSGSAEPTTNTPSIVPPVNKASLEISVVDTPDTDTVNLKAMEAPRPNWDSLYDDPEGVLLGKLSPAKDGHFSKIASQYTSKSNIYMHKEAYASFQKMHAAAKSDGIKLVIVSAFRSFYAQKGIWERKWTGQTKVAGKNLSQSHPVPVERARMILTYSSMPGTSRHHWGTDIDLNNLNNSWFASGEGKKVYDWLIANAAEYGFCQPYSPKGNERPEGYNEEKWHWSYLPVAHDYLMEYPNRINYANIKGFAGSEAAEGIDVIKNYVQGINPACKSVK